MNIVKISLRKFNVLAAILSLTAILSPAAVISYYGADNGAGPGGPFPNASAAQTAFQAALSTVSIATFEGAVSLANIGAGMSASIAGAGSSGLRSIDAHTPSPLGFNTTSGGSDWLQMFPAFRDPAGDTATFIFPFAVNGFGAWLTDTQSTFPGPITVTFNDGSAQTFTILKNDDSGGALFFGFVSTGSFDSFSISTGATADTRDIWGIDDIHFGHHTVPEPGSFVMLLGGAAMLLTARRFRR